MKLHHVMLISLSQLHKRYLVATVAHYNIYLKEKRATIFIAAEHPEPEETKVQIFNNFTKIINKEKNQSEPTETLPHAATRAALF